MAGAGLVPLAVALGPDLLIRAWAAAAAPAPAQDAALLQRDAAGFRDVLFTHAIEGTYSVPEYGGNVGLVGWREIRFAGDVQPVGWSDDAVARSDGPDPAVVDGVVQ